VPAPPERRFNGTTAKAGEKTFHAVYNAGTFANKAFTLAVRPFGVLFFKIPWEGG
jgi:hypothetical protein